MSESHYRYRFFFPTNRQAHAVRARIADLNDYEAVAKQLGFLSCLEEREYLDAVTLSSEYCELAISASASSDLNHRLIRASKEIGSEFCIVDMFNSQVGESDRLYLLRGQEVDAGTREELIQRYEPLLPAATAAETGDTEALGALLNSGLNASQRFDERSLLEIAMENRQSEAFKLLLAHGADANAAASSGEPLLLYAAKQLEPGDSLFALLLVKHGADISAIDKSGGSVLWYMGRLNRELHQLLARRGAVLSRPDSVYLHQAPVDALAIACEYFDKANIVSFFKQAVTHRESWLDIAINALRYDVPGLVTTLIKNGFLAGEVESNTFASLFDAALSAPTGQSFLFVFNLAREKGHDCGTEAENYLYQLADKPAAAAAIDVLLGHYPDAVTASELGCAIYARKADNLAAMLKHKAPFDAFAADYECSILAYYLDDLDVACTRALLDAGLDLAADEDGETLLEYCLNRSDCSTPVKRLLAGYAKDLPVEKRLSIYMTSGDYGAFKRAWPEFKVNGDPATLLLAAARGGPEFIRFLLGQITELAAKTELLNSALGQALLAGQAESAALLLAAGADANASLTASVNSTGQAAADADDEHEAEHDDEDEDDEEEEAEGSAALLRLFGFEDSAADALLKQRDQAQKLAADASCLMYCASQGELSLCRLLIKHGAAIWQRDAGKKDALMYAILQGQNACADFFIGQPDFAAQGEDAHGRYLYFAALVSNVYAIKALLKAGVSADAEHPDEDTMPLLLATIGSGDAGNTAAMDALLAANAHTGFVDKEGKTPLIHACMAADQPAIKALLAVGGFPSHVDMEGNCAFDYFSAHGIEAEQFSLDELKPRQKFIGIKKWLVRSRPLLIKVIIPAYLVFSIVAIFSETLATWGLSVVAALLLFKLVRGLMAARKTQEAQPKGLELALSAITKAVAHNEKKQAKNQAIINSWND